MDDPNITMEEYIRLEEEKARRHGQTFNWQTAMFGKVENYKDDDDCSIDSETEFSAIVFDNTLTKIPSEPTVCPPNENKVDFRISLEESDDEDYTEYTEEIRRSYEQRLETIWSRPVNQVHVLDFEGLAPKMRQDLAVRLRMVYSGEGQQVMSDTKIGLDVADTLCFKLGGVRRRMTDRLIPDKGDLRDYWIEISSERDFLGPAPSYVLIQDPVRRLCHMMITYSISSRGQAPKKVTEGRKSEARLSGGHFIRHLAMHFRLVSDEVLRGLQGLERQQAIVADPTAEEGAQGIPAPASAPAPAQAPPLPPPALQPQTMSQRIERVEEEVHDLQRDVLMDASSQTYQPFDSTLVGSSRLSFQRHVRLRTGDASTSAAPHTDTQPDA
ncbi:hypothetical protein Tco_0907724 [Tanacetum coccineum]|uniref:Uncharacterized protein n=1 Tax=Tanacetum coccineum TaxID=301880 RepID=A0ABQ5CRG6_9ASTR